jgi:hypothetical protein
MDQTLGAGDAGFDDFGGAPGDDDDAGMKVN